MQIEMIEKNKQMLSDLLVLANKNKEAYDKAFAKKQQANRDDDDWVPKDSQLTRTTASLKDFLKDLNDEKIRIVHTLMWVGLQKNSLGNIPPQVVLDEVGAGFGDEEWESKDEELEFLVSKPLLYEHLVDGLKCIDLTI